MTIFYTDDVEKLTFLIKEKMLNLTVTRTNLSEQLKEMVLIGIFLSTFISETSFRTMEVLVSGFPSVNIYTAVMSGSSKAI